MQTPRLCIDGRAAAEFDCQGLLAQELIDQLVSAQGDPHTTNEWIEKRRAVLLSHPEQVFAGQLKRFDTKRKIGSSFLYSAWEKHFIESSNVTAFHRFRPADRLEPLLSCPTITTVLPVRRSLGSAFPNVGEQHTFVVPSQADKKVFLEAYKVPEANVEVRTASVRRYVHFSQLPPQTSDGQILFLTDGKKDLDLRKLQHVVSTQYPHLPLRTFDLSEVREFSARQWVRNLQFASLCFYLTERNFDWPFLAFEALFFNVPVIFMDNHPALSEILSTSPLRLSKYLTDFTTSSQLKRAVEETREQLERQRIFEGHLQAQQYRSLYSNIPNPSA